VPVVFVVNMLWFLAALGFPYSRGLPATTSLRFSGWGLVSVDQSGQSRMILTSGIFSRASTQMVDSVVCPVAPHVHSVDLTESRHP
jgi:hypothetical protein